MSHHIRHYIPRPYYMALYVLSLILVFMAFANPTRAQDYAAAEPLKSWSDGGFEMRADIEGSEKGLLIDAPLLSSDVKVEISGFVVHTTIKQRFKNVSEHWITGTYRFPLPDKAAIDGFTMLVGDKRIVGKLKEKEEAKKIFNKAIKEGKKAALLNQVRPNMFTSKVGNVAPGSEIAVEMTFLSYLEMNGLEMSWALPQAITPRYNLGDAEKLHSETGIPSENYVVDGPGLYVKGGQKVNASNISITLNAGTKLEAITSPSHSIAVAEHAGGKYTVSMQSYADRDFILNWKLEGTGAAKPVLIKEVTEKGTYVLGIVMPPKESQNTSSVPPRDVAFIVDVSGSMHGVAIDQSKLALLEALDLLREIDTFDIILFNQEFTRMFGKSQPATAENIQIARKLVSELEADGGTEMVGALEAALDSPQTRESLRQVMFLTDGAVGYEEHMFKLVNEKLGNARLFTVGLGSAPNGWFMRKAAEFGRGLHVQMDNIDKTGDTLSALFKDMAHPSVRGLEIQESALLESYPTMLPDLFGERPAVFVAKLDENQPLTMSGITRAGKVWQARIDVANALKGKGLSKLWARKKVESIMDKQVRGYDASLAKAEILKVALAYEILSPYTSFVAVEQKVSRLPSTPLKEATVKANLPLGASAQKMFGPQTASPMELQFWLGLLAAMAAFIMFWFWKRQNHAV